MSDSEQQISMNPADLYREDTFTDQKVGTIRRLTPVTADGSTDATRDITYVGQTQVMTPAGALPISFELKAEDLADAANQFGPEAEKALEQTMQELQEMRRQQQSSIVVPGQGQSPGGLPGGGLQMP